MYPALMTDPVMLPVLPGRLLYAQWWRARVAAFVVGGGDPAWGETPPVPAGSETALVAPLGLMRARIFEYAVADAEGFVPLADGSRWTMTQTPQLQIYLQSQLGPADIPGQTVREIGIVLDPVIDAAVPPGQTFVPWAQVTDPGTLAHLMRRPPLYRLHNDYVHGELIEF